MKNQILENLITRYPSLAGCKPQIEECCHLLISVFKDSKKLLICGNGGSASDAEHIAGELMKGFMHKRSPDENFIKNLSSLDNSRAAFLGGKLQLGLPAIPLVSHSSVITAICNDNDPRLIFAQQVMALGTQGDVLFGISTSGNSENIICALIAAKAKGMKTIGLSGNTGGTMKNFCDIMIAVPAQSTPEIQELHLPVYHCICSVIEDALFK